MRLHDWQMSAAGLSACRVVRQIPHVRHGRLVGDLLRGKKQGRINHGAKRAMAQGPPP